MKFQAQTQELIDMVLLAAGQVVEFPISKSKINKTEDCMNHSTALES